MRTRPSEVTAWRLHGGAALKIAELDGLIDAADVVEAEGVQFEAAVAADLCFALERLPVGFPVDGQERRARRRKRDAGAAAVAVAVLGVGEDTAVGADLRVAVRIGVKRQGIDAGRNGQALHDAVGDAVNGGRVRQILGDFRRQAQAGREVRLRAVVAYAQLAELRVRSCTEDQRKGAFLPLAHLPPQDYDELAVAQGTEHQ